MSFNFHYQSNGKSYEVSFDVKEYALKSSCTCAYKHRICKHKKYIIAGKNDKLSDDEIKKQKLFLDELAETPYGKEIISSSKLFFNEAETCRRCNSVNIVDTRSSSLTAKLVKVFINDRRRYFCKSCKWSW